MCLVEHFLSKMCKVSVLEYFKADVAPIVRIPIFGVQDFMNGFNSIELNTIVLTLVIKHPAKSNHDCPQLELLQI